MEQPIHCPARDGAQAGGIAIVADDHELPRAAMRAILTQRLGMRAVVEASSLDEAVAALDSHGGAAMAIIDLNMPGMDGAGSLQAVRELYPVVPLVVFSASTDRQDMLAALAAGAHGYVPKHLRMGEIEAAIRLVLDGQIYVPPSIAVLDPPLSEQGAAPPAAPLLSGRQRDVLRLLRKGLSNKAIARELEIGEGTVKVHIGALFRVLGVRSRAAAVAIAMTLPHAL